MRSAGLRLTFCFCLLLAIRVRAQDAPSAAEAATEAPSGSAVVDPVTQPNPKAPVETGLSAAPPFQSAPASEPETTAPPVSTDEQGPGAIDASETDGSPARGEQESGAEADIELGMSAAELAELGFDTEGSAAVDTSLQLYGFVDVGIQALFGSDAWRASYNRHPSFFVGNFNVYLAKYLVETVRMLAEVRLTYLPNGARDYSSVEGAYVSTVASDYNDSERPVRLGAIEIERVYLDWSIHPLLTARIGQFLTPYGLWNVDHGSPTVVPVARPLVIGQQLFPERQTGIELLGRVHLSADHVLGYHLTLSNGFGPVSEYRDLDDNKAIGARVYWAFEGLGQLQVGVSGFYGRDTSARETINLNADGKVDFIEEIDAQSDVLSLAADAKWTYQGLLLQAEVITQQRRYTAQGRNGGVHPYLGTWIAPKDMTSYGGYAIAGYRFDWLGVMPYAVFEATDFLFSTELARTKSFSISAGLNIRPIESLVLKVDYSTSWYPDGFLITDDRMQMVRSQLAWAF